MEIMQTIYFARHATPDRSRTEFIYHIPPGPPLTQDGLMEARQVGEFFKNAGVKQIYSSPLERCLRTAMIAGEISGVEVEVTYSLTELRPDETPELVRDRLEYALKRAQCESRTAGPVALVTHGGPISVLMACLGMDDDTLKKCSVYDHRNPLPPAGVWMAQCNGSGQAWNLSLVFQPNGHK